MSSTLERIRQLVAEGSVRISEHGYDELAADGILAGEVLAGVESAQLVEDYPQYGKGPAPSCCRWTAKADQFMPSGASPGGGTGQQFWSRLIARIQTCGRMGF